MVCKRWRWSVAALAVMLGASGCHSSDQAAGPAAPAARGIELTVAAVGDPAILEAVAPQREDWKQKQGASIALRDGVVEPKSAAGLADLLLFPADRLGDLVDAGALAVLPESAVRPAAARPEPIVPGQSAAPVAPPPADPLDFADVLPVFRDQVTKYGPDRMALPYGGSALVLYYRRDALLNEANRAAAQAVGLELKPPATWEDFERLAAFFHGRDWDGDGTPESGLAAALGADAEGLGEATLLARAVGPGQHGDQFSFLFDADTLAPRVETPPFVEALEALARWKDFGPPGAAGFDAEAARKAFQAGEVMFLIDRAERAGRGANPKAPVPTGVAALPGTKRVFEPERKIWEELPTPNRPSYLPGGGGWLVGVSSAARGPKLAAAIELARYLTGPEVSARVRSGRALPMLPTRSTQLVAPEGRSTPGLVLQQWALAVANTLTSPPAARVIPGLRIPDAAGYLADLGKGRVAAQAGTPAAEALQGVAQAWTARTQSLGQARQLWHYRRSLNGPETTPEPPAR